MSTQTKLGKLISRFEIGFDDETKVVIDSLKDKLDEVTRALSVKNDSHGDRLLAAMQAEAANDSPVTYSPWENDLKRATVNDVDYLSGDDLDECVPHIDDVLDQPNWLSESVPQITQADMQLIFIKNLSETLIQRMHSMDRFSEDDYAIGGDKLMAWDIVVGKPYKTKEEDHNVVRFGVISCQSRDLKVLEVLSFNESYCNSRGESLAVYFSENNAYRTITEAELPAFRAALEACYA